MNLNQVGLSEEFAQLGASMWRGDVSGIVSFSTRLAQRASLATEPEQQQIAMLAGQASQREFSGLWRSDDRSWRYACGESTKIFGALRSMEDPFHAKWIDSALKLMAESASSGVKVMRLMEEDNLRRHGALAPKEWSASEIGRFVLRETRTLFEIHCLGSAGPSYGPDVQRALGSSILALAPHKRDPEPWSEFLQGIWLGEYGVEVELAEPDVLEELIEQACLPAMPILSSAPRRRG